MSITVSLPLKRSDRSGDAAALAIRQARDAWLCAGRDDEHEKWERYYDLQFPPPAAEQPRRHLAWLGRLWPRRPRQDEDD